MSKLIATVPPAESIFSPAVAELVAIAAAIGANCEPCLKYHYAAARKLGVSQNDMAKAVALADRVKRAPAQNMLGLADKLLGTNLAIRMPAEENPGCCSAKTPRLAGCKSLRN